MWACQWNLTLLAGTGVNKSLVAQAARPSAGLAEFLLPVNVAARGIQGARQPRAFCSLISVTTKKPLKGPGLLSSMCTM